MKNILTSLALIFTSSISYSQIGVGIGYESSGNDELNSAIKLNIESLSINNISYNVPCILNLKDQAFKLIRPNPIIGDAIIFSPYLIHGAAFNSNSDTTRIALELRLSRK